VAGTRTSTRVGSFTESVIREMTRLAMAHDAVTSPKGFPDFSLKVRLIRDEVGPVDA
jgi:hypothetical protein